MTDRYAKYTRFEFDRPAERVLRITLNSPKTYNWNNRGLATVSGSAPGKT